MDNPIKIIGIKKWLALSSRQKHTALAKFALDCLEREHLEEFEDLLEKLFSWATIDKFTPPLWLSPMEILENYFSFHQKFSGKPVNYYRKSVNQIPMPWKPKHNVTVVLDQVFSPYNVGSILRVIDNFGLAGLVHSTPHLDLTHPQLKKAARGCESWIPIKFEADLSGFMQSLQIPVTALEQTDQSTDITVWSPPSAFALVLGNESYGISKNILDCCDNFISIPMAGYKKSMNLSHALAITAFFLDQKFSTLT